MSDNLAGAFQLARGNRRPWVLILYVLNTYRDFVTNKTTLSDEKLQGPHPLNANRVDHSKSYPKSGTLQLEFNKTGTLLLARFGKRYTLFSCISRSTDTRSNDSESVPTSVHLFAFPGPGEAFLPRLRSVLLHSSPVIHVHWNPVRQGRLASSCGGQAMYLWSEEWIGESGAEEEMAECVGIPASAFNLLRIIARVLELKFFAF